MRHWRRSVSDTDARAGTDGNSTIHRVTDGDARTYSNRNPSYADARAIRYSDARDDGYRDTRSDTSHAACANWDARY